MIVVCSSEWFLVKNGTFRMLRLAYLFGRKNDDMIQIYFTRN